MRRVAIALFLLLSSATFLPLAAQSVVRGELRGVVSGREQSAVDQAFVVATQVATGATHSTYTTRDGRFDFPFLPVGEYRVRAEALGYRPRVLLGARVLPAQVADVTFALQEATPPVTRVDTVPSDPSARLGLGSSPSSIWLRRDDMARLPDRHRRMSGLDMLATSYDASLGSEGLPGSMTRVFVDGVPFEPARHPFRVDGGFDPEAVSRVGLGQVGFLQDGADVEWAGGAGGEVSVSSREGSVDHRAHAFVEGIPTAFWHSGAWRGGSVPSLNSLYAGADAELPLAQDSSRLFVGLEGMNVQIPRPSPALGSVAGSLAQLPAAGTGLGGSDPAAPWTEEIRSVSGVARLDWSVSPDASVLARLSLGTTEKKDSPLYQSPLAYGATAPYRGTDVSASAEVVSRLTDRLSLELRAGFERSDRDYSTQSGGPAASSTPPTLLVASGVRLGPDPGQDGQITRTEFYGGPTLHYQWGEQWIKAGAVISLPSYQYSWMYRSSGEYLFAGPGELEQGSGTFVRTLGAVTASDFTVPDAALFAQYRWDLTPGARVTTGVRYDREYLPQTRVVPNTQWADLTGIENNGLPQHVDKFGVRIGLTWDLTGRGTSIFRGTLSAYHGSVDPGAINEVLTQNGSRSVQRVAGGLTDWPLLPGSDAGRQGTLLALFGPSLDAPRTARASVGLSERVGEATTLEITGTFRRTQYLLRRTDLNRALQPTSQTDGGRPVYGELSEQRQLVTAVPGSNRRFPGFDAVWGLTADGWSEYRGVTVSLERQAEPWLDVFASYTYSSTKDNWVGAALASPEARLLPGVRTAGSTDWTEGPSDFDVPNRLALGVRFELPLLDGASLTALYRYRSGRPFTPGYPVGVDVNGDGSGYNDPAYVPDTPEVRALAAQWPCLTDQIGHISQRNVCRGDAAQVLDLHASVRLFRWAGGWADLYGDAFNLLDSKYGVRDAALLQVDPGAPLVEDPVSGTTTIPVQVNPSFGQVVFPEDWGRMVRVGLRVGLQ